jgi:heteromeric Ino2p/Ino4p transcription factor
MYSADDDSNRRRKNVKTSVLTEEQKKAHHIASEKKRRENIRSEFDRIVHLTPTLSQSENRSELNILTKSADYIDNLKLENNQLVELCRQKGINVPAELAYHGPTSDGSDVTK